MKIQFDINGVAVRVPALADADPEYVFETDELTGSEVMQHPEDYLEC